MIGVTIMSDALQSWQALVRKTIQDNDGLDLTVTDAQVVFDGFFQMLSVTFDHENNRGGVNTGVKRLIFERGDAVCVLMRHRVTNKYLLVKQLRIATLLNDDGRLIEAMAGIIDLKKGETPVQAAIRESIEETGYRPLSVTPIAVGYLSPGASPERVYLYYAEVDDTCIVNKGGGVRGEDEDIITIWLDKKAADAAITHGIVDLKTQFALLFVKARELEERNRALELSDSTLRGMNERLKEQVAALQQQIADAGITVSDDR